MVAFGRPLYREGLISPLVCCSCAVYGQLVYMYLGADEEKLTHARLGAAAHAGWEQSKVRTIVEETLEEVVEPIVYDEALDLIN